MGGKLAYFFAVFVRDSSKAKQSNSFLLAGVLVSELELLNVSILEKTRRTLVREVLSA